MGEESAPEEPINGLHVRAENGEVLIKIEHQHQPAPEPRSCITERINQDQPPYSPAEESLDVEDIYPNGDMFWL